MTSNDQPDVAWPGSHFIFMVDFGTALTGVLFQQMSGLESETTTPEYRTPDTPQFTFVKTPSIAGAGIVTLKRGIFVNNNTFWNWVDQIKMNTASKTTIVVKLLNDAKVVTMQWTLNNARPIKIKGADMKSDGGEIAVEFIEIAHEQLVISNGQ
jgi:phage tail-like protein